MNALVVEGEAPSVAHDVWGPVVHHGLAWWLTTPAAIAAWYTHGGIGIPLTISTARTDDPPPWSTSATTMFGAMALEEAERLPTRWGRVGARLGAPVVHALTRGLDPIAMLGSTAMSTYLHDADDPAPLLAAAEAVRARWPQHALAIRSLDEGHTPRILQAVRAAGWSCVPVRQVWHSDPRDAAMWRKRDTREDQKLLARTPLTRRDLTPNDAAPLVARYEALYLGKYSRYNPRVRVPAVAELLRTGGLRGEGFFEGETLLSAYACFSSATQMTATMVGYALEEPASRGLYRLAVAASLARAAERGLQLHMSAGADRFKQLRGARPMLEFLAVDVRHLPPSRRRRWERLSVLASRLAPRVFRDAP